MRLIDLWKSYREKHRIRAIEYNNEQLAEKAEELFQVTEHKSALWFTYDGHLVCPMSHFKEQDPVIVLGIMRRMFVEDNTIKP